MKRSIAIAIFTLSIGAFAIEAHAGGKVLSYSIDHGTVGVIVSGSGQARLIVQANGNCRAIPYSVVADGVLASKGDFDLSKSRTMPLDYTNVTLSCNESGVQVQVEQAEKSGIF